MARVRILLADDHVMLLDAFRGMLADEYEVVGTATDGRSLLEACLRVAPDLVLLDIAMPLLNGLDAGRRIRAACPSTRLIYLTMNPDPTLAAEALRLGASGYLLKSAGASELHQAIREVLDGRTYVTAALGERDAGDQPVAAQPRLTDRQREVLQLLAEGRPMKEIADILHLTPRTVAFHKYRLMELLQVRTSAELVRFAVRQGLVA